MHVISNSLNIISYLSNNKIYVKLEQKCNTYDQVSH